MIITKNGEIPINKIHVEDEVLTRRGWKKVDTVFCIGERECFKVKFSNGKELVGTGNHPIWVKNYGWKNIANLRYHDIVETWNIPTNIEELQEEYGQNIMARYHHAILFTIKMVIRVIMKFLTLNVLLLKNTQKFIDNKVRLLLVNVTGAMNRINIMPRTHDLDSAQINVKLDTDSTLKLIMKKEFVKSVEKSLKSIGMFYKQYVLKHVQKLVSTQDRRMKNNVFSAASLLSPKIEEQCIAPVFVKSVTLDKSTKVYNLTVSEEHEYYANGILVHNCTRYFFMSDPRYEDEYKSPITEHKKLY